MTEGRTTGQVEVKRAKTCHNGRTTGQVEVKRAKTCHNGRTTGQVEEKVEGRSEDAGERKRRH
jgi:hypothetical protein